MSDIPEMHSLQPNRTIPHPLEPALRLPRWRSRTLPSLPRSSSLESTPARSEDGRPSLLREEMGAEGGARGAEEGAGCWGWHFDVRIVYE